MTEPWWTRAACGTGLRHPAAPAKRIRSNQFIISQINKEYSKVPPLRNSFYETRVSGFLYEDICFEEVCYTIPRNRHYVPWYKKLPQSWYLLWNAWLMIVLRRASISKIFLSAPLFFHYPLFLNQKYYLTGYFNFRLK